MFRSQIRHAGFIHAQICIQSIYVTCIAVRIEYKASRIASGTLSMACTRIMYIHHGMAQEISYAEPTL